MRVPLLVVVSSILLALGCEFAIPEGRFACSTDSDCPPGLRCAGTRCTAGDGAMAPTDCPTLSAPANGSVDRTSGAPGEVAIYSCDAGFILTGNEGTDRRVCQADRTWTGSEPTCAEVISPCNPNPCLNGGTCTDDGTNFTCACGTRFGGATCQTPLACDSLSVPLEGSIDRTMGMIGDIATYSCNSGFYVVGERARTCQADGTWSGSDPTCASTGGYPVWPLPGTTGNPYDYSSTSDTVLDRVTGLEWQRIVDAGSYTWSDAIAYCTNLVLAGHSDWRLPTRIELISIVRYDRGNPAIDTSAFPATPTSPHWTSTPVANTSYAWDVYFIDGGVSPRATGGTNRVRCVR